MTKAISTLLALVVCIAISNAQTIFDEEISITDFAPTEIVMPPSPLEMQILFVGGTDMVQTTATYGNPAGEVPAKQWHDFIGFTPDETGESLGWVSVNHEMILADDNIGDGGGMTAFRVKRADDGSLEIMDQTLEDGRSGKFFNVDFANTVGETGMNCGGITSTVDGRIWTAEEWFRRSNSQSSSIFGGGNGVRDTADWTIQADFDGPWNGTTIKKYQNFNYMVEIDPRQAKAIRKQYNWGRQPFEGGAVNEANEIVYLGPDSTPGIFGMFVASTPGDFTKGTLFAYKHDKQGWPWVPLWEDGYWLEPADLALSKGATMFNRIEWVAFNPVNNFVYFTATGRDNPASRFAGGEEAGGVFHPDQIARAQDKFGVASPSTDGYRDYYGRIWEYDPRTGSTRIYLEGGPDFDESPDQASYPDKHLSNPDGLNVMLIDGKPFLVINEDLNGTSNGRVPAGVSNRLCELYILDLSITNPTIDDLIRLTAVPAGAEVTGAHPTPDGKSLLVNSQHPSSDNPFPFNNSLTFALNGFDKITADALAQDNPFELESTPLNMDQAVDVTEKFSVFPNPTTRTVFMNKLTDVAVYNANGKRMKVFRQVNQFDVSGLQPGNYFIQTAEGDVAKLNVQ